MTTGLEAQAIRGGKAPSNETHDRLLEDTRDTAQAAPLDQFKQFQDEQLEDFVKSERSRDPERVKLAYEELIRRHDARYTDKDMESAVPKMALLLDCLKQGKGLRPDGKGGYELAPDKPLSEEHRFMYHVAIVRTIELINNPLQLRDDYIDFLRFAHKYSDAVTAAEDSSKKANMLMKPFANRGGTTRMMDLILDEQDRLYSDLSLISDPRKRQMMLATAQLLIGYRPEIGNRSDSGIINAPVNADKRLTYLYLGTVLQINADNVIEGVRFGQNTGFKPDLAMQAAIRARDTLKYIFKHDPSTEEFGEKNPSHASLFGKAYEYIPNGQAFNMFVDRTGNGLPDLLEAASIENLNNRIRQGHKSTSMMLDVGVTALGLTLLGLTRNSKAATIAEDLLAKSGRVGSKITANPALAGTIGRGASYATVLGAAVPARHYGYGYLTGGEESWTSSLIHAGGTMAVAYAGSRVAGRATPIADNAAVMSKPFQVANFDAQASARLFEREGIRTTGTFAELLKKSSYRKEAAAFEKLAPETPITSKAAQDAIESTQLTYGRLTTISKAIVKEQNAAAKAARQAEKEAAKNSGASAQPHDERKLSHDATPESIAQLQTKSESAINKLKNQISDRFGLSPISTVDGTARQIARSRTGSAIYSSLTTTAGYNSLVIAHDIRQDVNGATGQKYTFLEALQEAHFPSFKDEEKMSWPLRLAGKIALGTPGESLFAAPWMVPGVMRTSVFGKTGELWSRTAHGVPYKVFKSLQWAPGQAWNTISPLSGTALNNANELLFGKLLHAAGAIGPNRIFPILEEHYNKLPTTVYEEMLEKARQPIQNDR